MAKLQILEYPDPRLRTVASPVTQVTDETRELIKDMFETMYAAPGIGLAATQVNVHQRILVADVSDDQSAPLVLINPEITESEGDAWSDEGCLSVPEIYEKVARAQKIRVRALGANGEPLDMEAEGLLAVCIQHEMDHLKGRVFVEYLSRLKRTRILTRIRKQEHRAG
jgi:peptide deformylase